MRMLRQFVAAAVLFEAQWVLAQVAAPVGAATEEHIRHVESGLIGSIVLKGDAHATHNLADRMKELNVPGVSIAVVHEGKIEWARGFGVASVGGAAVNAETMFQAGSISKPLAAMAMLKLVEQGKLSLDADINTYLSSWKLPAAPVAAGKTVTLRELLTHTAGITVHGFPGYASTDKVPTLVQVLNGEKPANTDPIRNEAAPGGEWKYSGGGYTIAQMATVDVTHEPFPKLLHDTVLAPIGMTHSTYEQPLPKEFQPFAATPYRGDGKAVEGGAHTYPEMAAAGLWTTPTDLCRYILEVQHSLAGKSNRVLSTGMTKQMVTAGKGSWGLGLEIGGTDASPYFSHGGANEGFRNLFVAFEKEGEGAVVMTNGDNGGEIGDEVMHSIAVEYNWPSYRPTERAQMHVDASVLAQYVGTYQLQPNFDIGIAAENGVLVAHPTGQQEVKLYPESETKFFALFPIEVEFVKDAQGKVTSMDVHQGGAVMKATKK